MKEQPMALRYITRDALHLFKRDFLINNNLNFKVGQLSEDIPWFINLLDRAKRCKFINQYIYAYRQNVVGSISGNFPVRHFDDILDIIKMEQLFQ